MLHQIKAQQFYTDIGLLSKVLSLQKIVEFKDLSRLLSDFPVLFKADFLLKDFSIKPSKFKDFSSLLNSSTFQACANPATGPDKMINYRMTSILIPINIFYVQKMLSAYQVCCIYSNAIQINLQT